MSVEVEANVSADADPLPPRPRSRAAAHLDEVARAGRFELQVCAACGAAQYPCRDACFVCLSERLDWQAVSGAGTLLARTLPRASAEPYFRARPPRPVGLVHLDRGPQIVCFLDEGAVPGGRVVLRLEIDAAGRAVFHAGCPGEDGA